MTDLVDRYLNAIKPLLPGDQREDIIAELADEISSRIEAREAELGRKLTSKETSAILKGMGTPLAVAARYGSGRALIGPMLFPMWWLAVRISVAAIAVVEIIRAVVGSAMDAARGGAPNLAQHLGGAWGDFWTSALFIIGLITLIAAAVERSNPEMKFDNWSPSQLPAAPRKPRRPTRAEGAFGIVFNCVFFLWLLGYMEAPQAYPAYLSPEAWLRTTTHLSLAQVWWDRLFAWMLAGIAGQIVYGAVVFTRPDSPRLLAAGKLLNDVLGIGFAVAVAQAGALFVPAPGLEPTAKVGQVLLAMNGMMRLAFALVGSILALDALWRLWRVFGPARRTAPAV